MTLSLSNMDVVEQGPRSRLLVPLFFFDFCVPWFPGGRKCDLRPGHGEAEYRAIGSIRQCTGSFNTCGYTCDGDPCHMADFSKLLGPGTLAVRAAPATPPPEWTAEELTVCSQPQNNKLHDVVSWLHRSSCVVHCCQEVFSQEFALD